MNVNEAKTLLLLYRPGTVDADDPQVAEALGLAKDHTELADWLKAQSASRAAIQDKFKQIAVPAGLKEQIISEHAASKRTVFKRRPLQLAMLAGLVVFGLLAAFWHPAGRPDNTLVIYKSDMVRLATGGYDMKLKTNSPAPIRAYLAQNQAPADFRLPRALANAELTGCADLVWEGKKVSLICFRTGKPLPSGTVNDNDMWLFVVDQTAVDHSPDNSIPKLAKVNRLATATWTEGGKLYFLGLDGSETEIRHYLDL